MRPTPLRQRFTPAPLALAAAMAVALVAGHAPLAHAQSGAPAAAVPIAINIPAQPLGQALNELARQANLQMTFPAALVAGKQSPAVSGQLAVRQALDRVLAGSGLAAALVGSSVVVTALPAEPSSSSEATLPAVRVTASAQALPGELAAPFAGGQVSRGARVGVLGNGDFMETPFNTTAFTQEFKQDIQARNLADIYKYAVSVQTPQSNSVSQNDIVNMRGFRQASSAATINGLGGLFTRIPPIDPFERFEILLGANAFANGQAGNVGGLMNLVTKRAGAEPLARVEATYESDSLFGAKTDLGQRFGDDKAWGVRFNGSYSDGDTAVEDTPRKTGVASLGIDYLGERLRVGFDVIHSKRDQRSVDFLQVAASVPVPRAPDASRLYNLRGTRYEQEFDLGMARAEFDLAPRWTVSAAFGKSRWNDHILRNYPTLTDAAGTLTGKTADYLASGNATSSEVVLRGTFATGRVTHTVSGGLTRIYSESRSLYAAEVNAPVYNLYDPPKLGLPAYPATYMPPFKGNDATTKGLFISDQIGLFDDRLLLTVGARKVDLRTNAYDVLTGARLVGSPYETDAVTPGYGVLFKVTPTLSVYGNHVEALENGLIVPSNPAYTNSGTILPPLESRQTEVGFKTELGKLAVTVALFQIDKGNQYADTATNTYVQNGRQRNRGFELSVFGEPVRGVRLYSGLSVIDAKIKRSNGGTLNGKTPIAVPGYTVTTTVDADVPTLPGLSLQGGFIRNDGTQFDTTNTRQVPGWTRFDIGARYRTQIAGKTTVFRLNVENVLNKNYFLHDSNLFLAAPRTFLLSATTDF